VIVHRELKPSDLILHADGSLRICGYATSIFEGSQYTKASQIGRPLYLVPEVYDNEHEGKRTPDPKMDVFSFGLILYEILFEQKVFPSALSNAVIVRKAPSDKPRDRRTIPTTLHTILPEAISRSWVSVATKRPPMETHWKRMREVGFKLFPGVEVQFLALTT
jgi:serine/threonine protein kinase